MSLSPIFTCDEVRAAERQAVAAGISLSELMERAGAACADALAAAFPAGRVVVLAGPGNNGGDAFVAARRLQAQGRDVAVFELSTEGIRTAEGAAARAGWTSEVSQLGLLDARQGDVVLDGLFGAGLTRPLADAAAKAVERVVASRLPVVSIDVPSGMRGDSGQVDGIAFRADVTVTFGALKPAHVLQPAAQRCGRVVVADIGFGDHLGDARLHLNGPELWSGQLLWPTETSHKHDRGRLFVVSGGMAQTGAARLSAQAGLRIGAGAVTLLTPPSAMMVAAISVTAVMTASFADAAALVQHTGKASAVVIGPAAGVTDVTRANVEALIQSGRRLVLDADALTVLAPDADSLASALKGDAVLTPHAGEFERMFPGLLKASANKIEAAREAARRTGAVVLLKGYDTVIACPDGQAVVNTMASPFLATAGSGDVLAGVIGGLMAQGLSAFDAACAGAWMHGKAAREVGPGLTAEDLDAGLKAVIVDLYDIARPRAD